MYLRKKPATWCVFFFLSTPLNLKKQSVLLAGNTANQATRKRNCERRAIQWASSMISQQHVALNHLSPLLATLLGRPGPPLTFDYDTGDPGPDCSWLGCWDVGHEPLSP